jgi:hypothetical protein
MLQMSTVSTHKFAIPRFSLFILVLGIFANLLAQVPASYPATIPAAAKNTKVVGHSTQARVTSHYIIGQNR